MTTYIAQDTFVGETADGAWVHVSKGAPFPDDHPLVILDRDAAAAAEKAGVSRSPLFRPMDLGEDEKPPAKSPGRAAAKTAKAS